MKNILSILFLSMLFSNNIEATKRHPNETYCHKHRIVFGIAAVVTIGACAAVLALLQPWKTDPASPGCTTPASTCDLSSFARIVENYINIAISCNATNAIVINTKELFNRFVTKTTATTLCSQMNLTANNVGTSEGFIIAFCTFLAQCPSVSNITFNAQDSYSSVLRFSEAVQRSLKFFTNLNTKYFIVNNAQLTGAQYVEMTNYQQAVESMFRQFVPSYVENPANYSGIPNFGFTALQVRAVLDGKLAPADFTTIQPDVCIENSAGWNKIINSPFWVSFTSDSIDSVLPLRVYCNGLNMLSHRLGYGVTLDYATLAQKHMLMIDIRATVCTDSKLSNFQHDKIYKALVSWYALLINPSLTDTDPNQIIATIFADFEAVSKLDIPATVLKDFREQIAGFWQQLNNPVTKTTCTTYNLKPYNTYAPAYALPWLGLVIQAVQNGWPLFNEDFCIPGTPSNGVVSGSITYQYIGKMQGDRWTPPVDYGPSYLYQLYMKNNPAKLTEYWCSYMLDWFTQYATNPKPVLSQPWLSPVFSSSIADCTGIPSPQLSIHTFEYYAALLIVNTMPASIFNSLTPQQKTATALFNGTVGLIRDYATARNDGPLLSIVNKMIAWRTQPVEQFTCNPVTFYF